MEQGLLIQLIGLTFNVIGSVLLGIPLFKTIEQRRNMAQSYFDKNPHLESYILKDAKFGVWGIGLLICGFALQIASLFI